MIHFLLSCLLFLAPAAHAGKIEDHRKELRLIIADTDKYEKRVGELKSLKKDTAEGPTLDTMVNEIADVQKKLLDLRRRKNALTEHLRLEHPNENLLDEMANARKDVPLMKAPALPGQAAPSPTADDALDLRLNKLLTQVQAQYSRTARERAEFNKKTSDPSGMVIDVEKARRKREILQEDKDKYLKETLQTKIKVDKKGEKKSADEKENGKTDDAEAPKD